MSSFSQKFNLLHDICCPKVIIKLAIAPTQKQKTKKKKKNREKST